MPLDDQNLDCLEGVDFGTPSLDRFTYLTPSLLTWVRNRSVGCDLAYVETRYFGGIGGQGAVLCRGGALAFGPAFDDVGPINEALTRMGVSETAGLDAFDIVGLSHYRGKKAWRDAGRSF